jgi:bifunctional non-homologous end joining protein LigD
LTIPRYTPADLSKLPDSFDHEDFVFELKMDGFRSLAHVQAGACQLFSRKGNAYKLFDGLCGALSSLPHHAVIDGEIVVLDSHGRPQFYDLLRRRGEPAFYAFDLLWLDGRDLCDRPLLERKRMLDEIVRSHPGILYARHHERRGRELFRLVCEQDLEGIVAKLKYGAYGEGWFKIRNPRYSQYEGRRELFERKRSAAAS